jgi:nucleoside-diphosphate-sugar epimerase
VATVAVTGASGFIGGHLVDALRAYGSSIITLARSETTARALEARECRVVRGDLHDSEAVRALVEGASIVFHVAGLVAARNEAEFHHVNAAGTGAVVRAASAAGVARVIHVSSLAVAGPTVAGEPLADGAPPRPVTSYARSKRAAEEIVARGRVPYTILRPGVVYGPGDRQLLHAFRWGARGIVPVIGDPGQELTLVHVRDLAAALIAATCDRCEGRTYNAVNPEIVTQARLGAAVARAVGQPLRASPTLPAAIVRAALTVNEAAARLRGRAAFLSRDKARDLLAPAWTASADGLARDAGWKATTSVAAGLAETAAWYRDAGWL